MILKEVIKKEEVREREVSLPFYYRSEVRFGGNSLVKVISDDQAIRIVTPDQLEGKLAGIDFVRTDICLNSYPVTVQVTQDEFEQAYWSTSLYLKGLAVPEYILSEDEKADFQNSY
jgi:hypothetical protein